MLKPEQVTQLQRIVGANNVLTTKEDLTAYSFDATVTWRHLPEVVVFPSNTQEISQALKLANEQRIPVTARGGGTNLSGGSIPIKGGILLVTTKMNKILEINQKSLYAVVEAGVVLQELNLALAQKGLFFPPDPQSYLGCTIGGMVSENAGGPACVKYGVTKQYLLGLEVVLASGQIVKLGGLTAKNRMGYELMMLFTGAEGTLGIITRATLKVLPLPPARRTLIAAFDDLAVAGETVSAVLSAGVIPSKIELMDNWLIRRIEELMPLGLPTGAEALLIFETDGIPEAADKEAQRIVELCRQSGAGEVKLAKDDAEAQKYWNARRAVFAALFSAAPTVFTEDITVPRDKIPQFIRKTQDIAKKYGVEICTLGHAGDGNLHPTFFTDQENSQHFQNTLKAIDELFEAALSLGGVLSGEHGIGLEKQKYFKQAMDPLVIDIMSRIKTVLDPHNILNPGKIWQSHET